MNELFKNEFDDIAYFSDSGITLEYTMGGGKIRRYYPYGSIMKIEAGGLLGIFLKITGKDIAPNGKNYLTGLPFDKADKARIKKAVAFAERKMRTAPHENMVENDRSIGSIIPKEATEGPTAEERRSQKWWSTRVKWRNTGLAIMLLSLLAVLIACFGDGGAFLAIAGAFGIFIGQYMFRSHLDPTKVTLRERKSNSGTKEIVKGAVIGGIVAGEAGAVVGATIAKNKLDKNEK